MGKLKNFLFRHGAATAIVAVTAATTIMTAMLPGVHRPEIIGTFVIIIALGVAGILMDDRPYSLCQVFFLFCVIFMGVMPMGQYITGFVSWRLTPCRTDTYLTANLLIIVCEAVFMGAAYYRPGRLRLFAGSLRQDNQASKNTTSDAYNYTWIAATAIVATAVFVWYSLDKPRSLLMRYDCLTEYCERPPMEFLAMNYIVRSIPAVALILCLLTRRAPRGAIAVTAVCTVVALFPTSLPRNQLAALALPLFMLTVAPLRHNKVLTLFLIVMMGTVFPLLNLAKVQLYFEPYTFTGYDFDSYQNFALVIDNGLITNGRQLLGTLLFWVPRAIWPGKPIGSGPELANSLHSSFINISMPIFGEGYINFGIAGVIIFTLAAALIFRLLDVKFDIHRVTPGSIIYLITLGSALFILRGPLMQGVSSLCALIISALIVYLPARAIGRYETRKKKDES